MECHFYIKRIISLPEGEGRLVSHSVQTPGHGEGTARVTVALGETAQAGATLGAFGQGASQLDTAEIQPKVSNRHLSRNGQNCHEFSPCNPSNLVVYLLDGGFNMSL